MLALETPISGSGGGGGGGKKGGGESDENTRRTRANLQTLELVSEGEIEGYIDQEGNILTTDISKAIYLDQTPIQNSDDTYNYDNVLLEAHRGLADEGHFNGINGVETPYSVEVQVKKNTGAVQRTIVDENADAIRVIMRIPTLVYRNKKDGSLKRTSVSYAIDVRPVGGTWVEKIVHHERNQKSLSPFQIQHYIKLPVGGNPWDVRVRRITADEIDTDESGIMNETWWESYLTLVEGKFTHPHTAMFSFGANAEDMGSSLPARSARVRGIKVRVPSNYNPYTRAYTGIWDGTFKIAWTNNPAWIFLDLIANDRYGLGDLININQVDKWSLYTIAQYCDQEIPSGYKDQTGADILENRFTYNGVINRREEAYFVLQQITTCWRGMAYWSLGQVFANADMPADPVKLVTAANVLGGQFSYSGTSLKARHTVVIVKFNNKDDFYRQDSEVVIDDAALAKYGWREKSVDLAGCTSRGQAHRYGKWILDTEQNATETVSYEASWDHAEVRPGDIVALSDAKRAGAQLGGRVVSAVGTRVTLDRRFEPAVSHHYSLMMTLDDGTIETQPITGFDHEVVTIAAEFSKPIVPNALFTITGSDIQPKQYRLLTIEESEPHVFKLTGLIHDPTKFARVERNIQFEAAPVFRDTSIVLPPTNLRVDEIGYVSNGSTYHNLQISWSPPASTLWGGFDIRVTDPTGNLIRLGPTTSTSVELQNAQTGEYQVEVCSIGITQKLSAPASMTYEVMGPSGYAMPEVSDLRLTSEAGAVFNTRDLNISWDNLFALSTSPTSSDGAPANVFSPHYVKNTLEIYDASTNVMLRKQDVTTPNFVYLYDVNRLDSLAEGFSGPRRNLKIVVTVTDIFGRVSTSIQRIFQNPQIGIITPNYSAKGSLIQLGFTGATDADFAGIVVHRSDNPGVSTVGAPLYKGANNPLTITGEHARTYYFKMGAFDSFGETGINYTGEFAISTDELYADYEEPTVPTGLKVTSSVIPTGARVVITWNANTEADLAGYDVEIRRGTGSWVSSQVAGNRHEFDSISGIAYSVRVRARTRISLLSGWSPVVEHVAAVDTVAPAAPTGLSATSGLTSVWLSWTNPADLDLDHIEIYEGTTNNVAAATLIARVTGTTLARTGLEYEEKRFYWAKALDHSGNTSVVSNMASVTTAQMPTPVDLNVSGLSFVTDDALNTVSWGAFNAIYGRAGEVPTTTYIASGASAHIGDDLFLYYVPGDTMLMVTSNPVSMFLAEGQLIAIYRGGHDVEVLLGKSLIDGNSILTGTVGANQLVVNDAIITNSLQLANAVVTSAKIEDLDAAKIRADTVLAGSVKIGGTALSEIRDNAADPAVVVNAGTTQIDPGKIVISGSTTLADWRRAGDDTKIDGGALSANTVRANSMVIGNRGIHLSGVTFEFNSPSLNRVSWTAGTLDYVNDAGASAAVNITAGSATWASGRLYIYWAKGATTFATTTNFTTASGDNNVILAVYRGNKDLVTEYGRTVIDGDNIKTGSVQAHHVDTVSLSAISANIGDVTAGVLRSADNKFIISLDDKTISIEV